MQPRTGRHAACKPCKWCDNNAHRKLSFIARKHVKPLHSEARVKPTIQEAYSKHCASCSEEQLCTNEYNASCSEEQLFRGGHPHENSSHAGPTTTDLWSLHFPAPRCQLRSATRPLSSRTNCYAVGWSNHLPSLVLLESQKRS